MLPSVPPDKNVIYSDFVGNYWQDTLLEQIDFIRSSIAPKIEPAQRAAFGQYFTPISVARFMARLFESKSPAIHLLDAGAGTGALSGAFVSEVCARENRPREISITAYEIDELLLDSLNATLESCRVACQQAEISFRANIIQANFVEQASQILKHNSEPNTIFTAAILNPPYRKIRDDSLERRWLRDVGVETTNLYTAFIWLAMRLLKPQGELIAITPRSFCNGAYFKPFRHALTRTVDIRRVHIFNSRTQTFKADEVLQENIIFHAVKTYCKTDTVTITSNSGPSDPDVTQREVQANEFIKEDDPDFFLNFIVDELGQRIAEVMSSLTTSLKDLGIQVSTGRVVDFRAKEFLRQEPGSNAVPLIYPAHFKDGYVQWPQLNIKKPNAIVLEPKTEALLCPPGVYVLVKRFSSNEQKRRIVTAIYDSEHVSDGPVGFENHLNYYHCDGAGLPINLAYGMSAFLNSTVVDTFFRQFSGHTQVNATDLKSLKYPDLASLNSLGQLIRQLSSQGLFSQDKLDDVVAKEIFKTTRDTKMSSPIQAKKRIDEAMEVLRCLNLPRAQQNERSALTLLALLDLTPEKEWEDAQNPLRGITPMMEFFAQNYGKTYAPNTRETVRRQSVHQFMQAGLITYNPDNPTRPVNSGKTVYQITNDALELLRSFDTIEWDANLQTYMASLAAIQARFSTERSMQRIAVSTQSGELISLSPGGQNLLIKLIIEEFCPRYTPKGKVLYIGDADEKWAFYDSKYLAELGVTINEHGKMPDVLIHHVEKNWLILIEAVTSHGPVDVKRHIELKELFANSTAGLVFVTTFLDRVAMRKYLSDIAWETEVRVSDAPDHLIHFNGERFLGPYDLHTY